MTEVTCNRRRTYFALVCLGAAYVILVLLTRPVLEHVSDAYQWIEAVKNPSAETLLHPHHLIYNLTAFCWYRVFSFLGEGRIWFIVAAMSAFAGAGTLIIVGRLAAEKTSPAYGLAAAGLLGATYAFWYFSGEIETYVPAALWGTSAFAVLCRLREKGALRLGCAVILWSFAVLLHQSLIFMAPALAFLTWRGSRSGKQAALRIGALWLFTGAICFAAYALGAFAAEGATGLRPIFRWATKFGAYGYYGGFNRWAALRAAVGLGRSIIHGRLLYAAVWSGVPWPVLIGLGAPLAYTGFALILMAVKILRRFKTIWRTETPFAGAVLWFLSQAAFSLYFNPANVEWWAIPLIPLVIALAIGAAQASTRETKDNKWLLAFTAAVVLFANLSQDIVLLNDETRNENVAAARLIARLADVRDLVVAPAFLKPRIAYAERGEIHRNAISLHTVLKDARDDRARGNAELEEHIRRTAENGGKVIYLARLITDENASLHGITPNEANKMLLKHLKTSKRKATVTVLWPDRQIGKPWPKIRLGLFVGTPVRERKSPPHHR